MKLYEAIGIVSPRCLINIWYRNIYGGKMDFENPCTIDDKVNWLKLHSDIALWTRCADKLAVRDYVREKGLESTLNDVYGVYDKAGKVDFSSLPDSFVLKSTNGGGARTVLIVPSKSALDERDAVRQMRRWLRHKEGYKYFEPQYKHIRPRIIAEKYLEPSGDEISLVDIKINCVNGKAHSVLLCSDRELGKAVSCSVYDMDWVMRPDCIIGAHHTDKVYPRPASFDLMVEYSEMLSEGIPFVRVDWYEIEGKPVFSEMTFTPAGGYTNYYSEGFRLDLGAAVTLPSNSMR